MLALVVGQVAFWHEAAPDAVGNAVDQPGGLAAQQDVALVDDRHVGAQVGHVGDDVGRQQHGFIGADVGQ
jgi:hypothetical protein